MQYQPVMIVMYAVSASVLSCLLSLTAVHQRRPSDAAVRGISLLLWFTSLWTLSLLLEVAPARTLLTAWGEIWLSFLVLHQTRRLLARSEPSKFLLWSEFGAGILLMVISAVFSRSPLQTRAGLSIVSAGIILAGFLVFWIESLSIPLPTQAAAACGLGRNRTHYWLLALMIFCIGAVTCLFINLLAGNTISLLGLVVAVYSQSTYRLPEFRWTVRGAVQVLGFMSLTICYFAGYSLVLRQLLLAAPGAASFAVALVLGAAVAILVVPVIGLSFLRKRRFEANPIHYQAGMMGDPGWQIGHFGNRQDVTDMVLEVINGTLGARHSGFFTVSYVNPPEPERPLEPLYDLNPVGSIGCELSPARLSGTGFLVKRICRDRGPLFREEMDFNGSPAEHGAERDWMDSMELELCVPVFTREHTIGVLVLGPKCSGACYYDDEVRMLTSLCGQVGMALENTRLSEHARSTLGDNERLAAELRSAHHDISQTDKAKSDFISIASHELRTPLTQVTGYVDMLEEMLENPAPDMLLVRKSIRGAKKAADRMVDIVSTMLDIYQLEAGTLTLIVKPESIGSILTASMHRWSQAAVDRSLHLEAVGLTGLPEVIIDGRRIKQVFDHLVQNAIKFTPDGGKISITGRVIAEDLPLEAQSIEIVVRDSGIGIKPEDKEQIFDKFYRSSDVRLHSSGETKFGGAGPGLGLTITRGFIQAHGGRIFAVSPVPDDKAYPGSEFHVILPIQPPFSQKMKGDSK